jgi:hypothetical protein
MARAATSARLAAIVNRRLMSRVPPWVCVGLGSVPLKTSAPRSGFHRQVRFEESRHHIGGVAARPDHRLVIRTRNALIAAIALVVSGLLPAASAGAQAPSLGDFKLRETTVDLQSRVNALGTRLLRSDVQPLLAEANRTAVENGPCKNDAFEDIPAGSRWFCFDRQDAGEGGGQVEWIPQGVSTVADAGSGPESLLVSWYDAAVEPKKGVRVTFLEPNTGKYRHVLLVYPYMDASRRPTYEIVGRPQGGIHAGGILWYGNYLYVVDTRRGIRVFDMRHIFDLQRSPNGDTTDRTRIGWRSGKYRGFGYRYVMPQVDAWVNAAGPDNEARCEESGAPRFSYISVDRGESPHRLITGEFCESTSDQRGRVARWPLDALTGRPVPDPNDGLVHASEAYRLPERQIQGAVSYGGTWYLSRSNGSTRNGQLILARPDAQPAGSLHATETRRAGIGPEDLSFWPARNQLWTVTEHAGRRMLYGVPR